MTNHSSSFGSGSVLQTPLLNRGSAFTLAQRRQLGIEALLPAGVNTLEQQAERAYRVVASQRTPIGKYRELMGLQDRSEYLFYRVLLDHLPEFLPVVYTPTVGEAAQKFSEVFQRGRGLWITPEHRGRVRDVIADALGSRPVKLLVVTDNEAILGLGDQGAGGMTISIGKLALYTACAGIAPEQTLPISLDVGTNNAELRADPNYLGLCEPRLTGAAYDELVEEFVCAIETLFPGALLQWEDFRKDNALNILDRYRSRLPSFNDDIQGTGAVTLAGVFSALRIKTERIEDQRFLIYGAGAAGLGIARQIKAALVEQGINGSELDKHIGLLDSRGLLVDDAEIVDDYKRELAWHASSANAIGLGDTQDRGLRACVAAFKPTVLIGSSGQAGAFSEDIVREMCEHCPRPVILPLSNPTSASEAQPEDLIQWTHGQAIVATGSPFDPVEFGDRTHRFGQGNNVFIFPGLGFASLLGEVREVTDNMITAAAKSLAQSMLDDELAEGLLYPDVSRLRDVTTAVSIGVLTAARDAGLTNIDESVDLQQLVESRMWLPEYADATS
ncbi:MAG: NAD-dependent malic enzyme [Pseudomonadaceae bacterium]|nr:NAD-dependent malic enzyme [Pseudomonadaceae bacterium]